MPTSSSDYMTLVNGQQSALSGNWCEIKKNVTKLHGYRTYAQSGIVITLVTQKTDGTIISYTLSISQNTTWYQTTIDTTDVVCGILYYNGSLGSGNTIRIYFD